MGTDRDLWHYKHWFALLGHFGLYYHYKHHYKRTVLAIDNGEMNCGGSGCGRLTARTQHGYGGESRDARALRHGARKQVCCALTPAPPSRSRRPGTSATDARTAAPGNILVRFESRRYPPLVACTRPLQARAFRSCCCRSPFSARAARRVCYVVSMVPTRALEAPRAHLHVPGCRCVHVRHHLHSLHSLSLSVIRALHELDCLPEAHQPLAHFVIF